MLYYLSGLTCTDENFIQKAGAQRKAAELGVALVAPDTSPRGLGIEGEDDRCGGWVGGWVGGPVSKGWHDARRGWWALRWWAQLGCLLGRTAAAAAATPTSAPAPPPMLLLPPLLPLLRAGCSYDFGSGAGFYLDASESKWQRYRMYSYITRELPALLRTLPELDVDRVSGWGWVGGWAGWVGGWVGRG